MKNKKIIFILTILIVLLAGFAAGVGIFSDYGSGMREIETFRGETVTLYGKGLYQNDSVSVAAQAKAQDVVTLFLGIPLLLVSLCLSRKESLKGRLLLTGTLGYFLYTYVSYTFLSMYNPLFLIYVILMSAGFFAFTLCITSIDSTGLSQKFHTKLPVRFLGGVQLFLAFALLMMWLKRILPSLTPNAIPIGIEHYSTLVIQGMDLGFIVPIASVSGILLIKRKPLGYLLSSVVIMKGFTMGAAITAMVINQYAAGVSMSVVEIILFPLISLLLCLCLIILLKNIKE